MMRWLVIVAASALSACGAPPATGTDGGDRPIAEDAGVPLSDAGSDGSDAGAEVPDTGGLADSGSGSVDVGGAPGDAGTVTVDASVDAGAGAGLQPTICSIWESQIFSGCANGYCHGGGAGGFRMDHSSAQALHDSIVNVESQARMYYVVPENDRMSYLINKLDGTQGQLVSGAGERMPPGGGYLSFEQLEVLRRWINDGASADCP